MHGYSIPARTRSISPGGCGAWWPPTCWQHREAVSEGSPALAALCGAVLEYIIRTAKTENRGVFHYGVRQGLLYSMFRKRSARKTD